MKDYVYRFACACAPEHPELFLSTGERNMLETATEIIEELRAEVSVYRRKHNAALGLGEDRADRI